MRQFFLSGVGFLSRSQTLTSWIPAQPQRTLSTTTEPPAAPPHTGQTPLPLENSVAGLNGCKGFERASSSSNIHCFRQRCGSALVSMRVWIRIRIQHFLSLRIRIQIHGFDVQKLEKKITAEKNVYFFKLQNLNFPHFCGSLWLSWIWIWIRIRIHNADPDPAYQNECGSGSATLVFGFSCHPFPRSAYFQQLRILIRSIGLTFLCSSIVFSEEYDGYRY